MSGSPTIRPGIALRRLAVLIGLAGAAACGERFGPGELRAPATSTATVADGLHQASAAAALPDGRLAIAEPGRLRVVEPGSGRARTLPLRAGPPVGAIAPGPDVVRTGVVLLRRGAVVERLVLPGPGRDRAGFAGLVATLPDFGDAAGGGLATGPDGRVYAGIPAGGRWWWRAAGIARLNPDGSVPVDNPGEPGDPLWARGLAAPVDLLPASGGDAMLVIDRGGGRVVRLGRGESAGWPWVRGAADGPLERLAARAIDRFRPPLWLSPGPVPVAAIVLRDVPYGPALEGRLLVGLDDGRILQVAPGDSADGDAAAGPFAGPFAGGIVDLARGTDGRVWVLTPTALFRIDPAGRPVRPRRPTRPDTLPPAPEPWQR